MSIPRDQASPATLKLWALLCNVLKNEQAWEIIEDAFNVQREALGVGLCGHAGAQVREEAALRDAYTRGRIDGFAAGQDSERLRAGMTFVGQAAVARVTPTTGGRGAAAVARLTASELQTANEIAQAGRNAPQWFRRDTMKERANIDSF